MITQVTSCHYHGRADTLRCGKLTLNIQRPYKAQQVAIAIFEQNIRAKQSALLPESCNTPSG